MNGYLMIVVATILLAVMMGLQRLYQVDEGTSMCAGTVYNMLQGAFAAVIFWGINGFRISLTPYSIIMSVLQTILVAGYTLLGFQVMKMGGLVQYSLFLMTGGMVVPYIWGILFLGEEFTLLHTLALVIIIVSIVFYQEKGAKFSLKLFGICSLIFIMNGFVSVISKLHQIETTYFAVSANEFVFLTSIAKSMISAIILLSMPHRGEKAQRKAISVKSWGIVACSAAACGISYLLQLKSAVDLPATVLYPMITGGTILFSGILSVVFFKEKLSVRGWSGIVLCIVGTCLIA